MKNSNEYKQVQLVRFDPADHYKQRNRRGRISFRVARRGVVEITEWKRYLRSVLKRVGWMRSGWAKAIVMMGGRVRGQWITRHLAGNPKGYVINGLHAGPRMHIEVGNYTPGIRSDRMQQRLNWAMKRRIAKISYRIRLVMSGYAKELGRNTALRRQAASNPTPITGGSE